MVKRVLVGVDFSEASRRALDRGRSWAERLGVPLAVLHVLQTPAPMLPEAQIALPDSAWLQSLEEQARSHLDTWTRDLPGVEVLVRWGSPAEELVTEADPETLLVVAQRGHSLLERLLFGSTANRVVSHAQCDVLVVRAEDSR
jgi:universal stress protein A